MDKITGKEHSVDQEAQRQVMLDRVLNTQGEGAVVKMLQQTGMPAEGIAEMIEMVLWMDGE